MAEPELRPSGVLFKAEGEGPDADPAGVVDELFAIQVRETRERLKMSQGELARQMSARGFPYYQQTVRRIEDSQRKVSVGEAKALAEILGTTIDRLTEPVSAEKTGYRGPTVCAAAGITPRQLDYWAKTGLVEPSVPRTAMAPTRAAYTVSATSSSLRWLSGCSTPASRCSRSAPQCTTCVTAAPATWPRSP